MFVDRRVYFVRESAQSVSHISFTNLVICLLCDCVERYHSTVCVCVCGCHVFMANLECQFQVHIIRYPTALCIILDAKA